MALELPTGPAPGMRTVWILRSLFAIPLVPLALPYVWVPLLALALDGDVSYVWFWLTLLGPVLSWVAWSLVYWPLYHARNSFRFEDDTVVIKKGVFFRRTVHIPLRRVQDVIVKEGPLLGAFSLATIHLQTAAQGQTNRAEGRLPGLRHGDKVAEELVRRIKMVRAD